MIVIPIVLALLTANSLTFDNRRFILNGEPVNFYAGEMHPQRIPYQYWEHRIKMSKAMGMNTISVYFMWNAFEQEDGTFDFTEENDV